MWEISSFPASGGALVLGAALSFFLGNARHLLTGLGCLCTWRHTIVCGYYLGWADTFVVVVVVVCILADCVSLLWQSCW